jgi:thioredoxin 1
MTWWKKLFIFAALIGAVVFVVEHKKRQGFACPPGMEGFTGFRAAEAEKKTALAPSSIPRLLDLGAGHCVPCKMMKPILTELQTDYAEQFETIYIDIAETRAAAEQYGVRVIPTQIFFDAEGNELFRHEGFMAKEDILAKWAELGINLSSE